MEWNTKVLISSTPFIVMRVVRFPSERLLIKRTRSVWKEQQLLSIEAGSLPSIETEEAVLQNKTRSNSLKLMELSEKAKMSTITVCQTIQIQMNGIIWLWKTLVSTGSCQTLMSASSFTSMQWTLGSNQITSLNWGTKVQQSKTKSTTLSMTLWMASEWVD